MPPVVTPERFAAGMTFPAYVEFIGSAGNLKREASGGGVRTDTSAQFRAAYESCRLDGEQVEALKWLVAQPGAPARILVISEDWSSDCQRDVPTVARIAEATGMELRIFNRDGQRFSASQQPSLAEAPDSNADLTAQFLNHKKGQTWQSIPVVAFFTRELDYLYHYTEYPAIYDKDRVVVGHIRAARPGETPEQTLERGGREFGDLRRTPFWRIWAGAAVDEMISGLHRRLAIGAG